MTFTVRRTTPDEYLAASNAKSNALLQPPSEPDKFAELTPSWDESSSFAAWDGDRCVGHAAQFLFDTVVPGGAQLPTGAVTRVGVVPTDRRRGIASALMAAMLDDAVDRDLALMSLRASEGTIYRRYHYAPAGDFCSFNIDPSRALPLRGDLAPGTIELIARDRVLDVVDELYPLVSRQRAGAITRPRWLLERYLASAITTDKAGHVAVHRSPDGRLDGYAHYEVEWAGDSMFDAGTGHVADLFAIDGAVELALWNFVLSIDLVRTWNSDERPLDDIIRHAGHDLRALNITSVDDEQWIRLVDVDRCLNARSYRPMSGSVTIAVTDPDLEANNRTWRIDAHGATATTDEEPDIVAPVSAMAAVYMGARSFLDLATLGDVTGEPSALALASDLFTTTRLPVCGSFF